MAIRITQQNQLRYDQSRTSLEKEYKSQLQQLCDERSKLEEERGVWLVEKQTAWKELFEERAVCSAVFLHIM